MPKKTAQIKNDRIRKHRKKKSRDQKKSVKMKIVGGR